MAQDRGNCHPGRFPEKPVWRHSQERNWRLFELIQRFFQLRTERLRGAAMQAMSIFAPSTRGCLGSGCGSNEIDLTQAASSLSGLSDEVASPGRRRRLASCK